MQVNLAGYNIDSSLIARLQTNTATPEVISAAYARISRSHKTVTELREEALLELDKARRSNRNIIFELGHSSVAEHAVFNFDVIGISRLLTETLETLRFASFTEKSQRYVTFKDDFVTPYELRTGSNLDLLFAYEELMQALFEEYKTSLKELTKHYESVRPELTPQAREYLAKEDARYILPLATKTQLGMTLNARSLEVLLARLDANPLHEAKELHAQLLEPIKSLCPSLVRYTTKDAFTGSFKAPKMRINDDKYFTTTAIRVIGHTDGGDDQILAALLFEQTKADFPHCQAKIASLKSYQKLELWEQIFANIKPWNKMHRAFELAELTFEIYMSESCWAQFKRHRVGTMIKQQSPAMDLYVLPENVQTINRHDIWDELIDRIENLMPRLSKFLPDLSPYVRINSHKVKVLVKMNLRELYHFVRLRSDEHAQWEIREISNELVHHLRVYYPQSTAFLCGKSEMQPTPDAPEQKD